MSYIVYKTTNLVNNKFYIGVHNLDAVKIDYLGSGKLLKQAIKKYGRENFKRETLQEFSNEQDAYDYEKELVNEEMLHNPLCYNLVEGGGNPPTFYGENNWMHTHGFKENHPMRGKHHSEESKSIIGSYHKGKVISKEQKIKMSIKLRGTKIGKNNHQSLSCCIKGELFESLSAASKYFNVSRPTISNWCKSPPQNDCYFISN